MEHRPPRRPVVGDARIPTGHRTIVCGWTRLTLDDLGVVCGGPCGLFVANTRLLSSLALLLDGQPPECALTGLVTTDRWTGSYRLAGSTEEGDLPEGAVPRGAVELRVSRRVAEGLREEWWLENHDGAPRTVTVELRLEARIADAMLVQRRPDGAPASPFSVEPDGAGLPALVATHDFGPRRHTPTRILRRERGAAAPRDGDRVVRGLRVRVDGAASDRQAIEVEARPGALLVRVALPPRGARHVTLRYEPLIDGRLLPAPDSLRDDRIADDEGPRVRLAEPLVDLVVEQARQDLHALRLPIFGADGPITISAGLPLYLGMFARDSLTTAWQAGLLGRHWMDGVLSRLGALQSDVYDPFREAEPGRLPHERRLGPRAATGEIPHELYYGDVASPPFFVVALAGAWSWLGGAVIDRHLSTAERCIGWVERALERGGGLVWDEPFPGAHSRNHGWKDSGDGIVDGRGRVRAPPLALVEVQGYCHLALLSFAAIVGSRGHLLRARRLLQIARRLRAEVDARFWMEREGFYALALDRDGNQVDAVASNAGHALGTGVFPRARVEAVARRLLAPDLFSGWGVRTLSSENPAYDPFSYHRGSVWPVENATIAAALALWGFRDEAERIIFAQFEAATRFEHLRLPEVFGGQPRDERHPLPGLYPSANPVQAWSASSVSLMLQTLLGLRAFAPLRTLAVWPRLPTWLPEVTIEDLGVGGARVSLRFFRDRKGRSRFEVLALDGELDVVGKPSALAPEATFWSRLAGTPLAVP